MSSATTFPFGHIFPPVSLSPSLLSINQVWCSVPLTPRVAASLVSSFSIRCKSCVIIPAVESVATATIICSLPMVEGWVSTPAIPMLFALVSKYDSISRVALMAVQCLWSLLSYTKSHLWTLNLHNKLCKCHLLSIAHSCSVGWLYLPVLSEHQHC